MNCRCIFVILFLFSDAKASSSNFTNSSDTVVNEACSFLISVSESIEQRKICYKTLPKDECDQKYSFSRTASIDNPIILDLVFETVPCITKKECLAEETEIECENRKKKSDSQCVIEKVVSFKERYCSHSSLPS